MLCFAQSDVTVVGEGGGKLIEGRRKHREAAKVGCRQQDGVREVYRIQTETGCSATRRWSGSLEEKCDGATTAEDTLLSPLWPYGPSRQSCPGKAMVSSWPHLLIRPTIPPIASNVLPL